MMSESIYYFLKYHYKAFLVVVLCLFNLLAKEQNFEFNNKRKRGTLTFKLVKNLMIIPLYLNSQGPFNFILDTGVGIFIISDTTLIDKLHIEHLRSIKMVGFGDGEERCLGLEMARVII